jgi:hypothetical protein
MTTDPVEDHNNNELSADDVRLCERTRALLEHAAASLSADDKAQRIAWCKANNTHGTRMYFGTDDDLIEFKWGGKTLAMVPHSALLSDDPLRPEFIPEAPDTIPEDWTEQ